MDTPQSQSYGQSLAQARAALAEAETEIAALRTLLAQAGDALAEPTALSPVQKASYILRGAPLASLDKIEQWRQLIVANHALCALQVQVSEHARAAQRALADVGRSMPAGDGPGPVWTSILDRAGVPEGLRAAIGRDALAGLQGDPSAQQASPEPVKIKVHGYCPVCGQPQPGPRARCNRCGTDFASHMLIAP